MSTNTLSPEALEALTAPPAREEVVLRTRLAEPVDSVVLVRATSKQSWSQARPVTLKATTPERAQEWVDGMNAVAGWKQFGGSF